MDAQTIAHNELMKVLAEMESSFKTMSQRGLGECVFSIGGMLADSHARGTNDITQRLIEVLTKLRAEITKREEALENGVKS